MSESVATESGARLAGSLKTGRREIERLLLLRIAELDESTASADGALLEGRRLAVSAGFEYTLELLERGGGRTPTVPPAMLMQARLAARCGIPLDLVLRRCVTGVVVLADFVLREASAQDARRGGEIISRLRNDARATEAVFAALSEEYKREAGQTPRSNEERLADQVRRLLRTETTATTDLDYEFKVWHVGLVARGEFSISQIRRIADCLDKRLLAVQPGANQTWAWLGGARRIQTSDLANILQATPAASLVAIGEPAFGLEGWRMSHRQAVSASSIVEPGVTRIVQYADVALLVAALNDEVLRKTLHQVYVAPLLNEKQGGRNLIETLDAYLKRGRSISSTAASVRSSRQTVRSHLRLAEERLGRSIDSCAADLEIALRVNGLNGGHPAEVGRSDSPTSARLSRQKG